MSTARETDPAWHQNFDPSLVNLAELGDHELVAGAGGAQGGVEPGASGEAPGGVADVDLFAAGRGEGVVLGFGVLVAGSP
jgi:hypothetical protein